MSALLAWLWYWFPPLVYMALIFYLSSLSEPPVPGKIPDWVLHAAEYAMLGALAFRAMNRGFLNRSSIAVSLLALIWSAGYGVTDEIHQLYVPEREFSWQDLAVDFAGSLLAVAVLHYVTSWKSERNPP